MPLEGIGKAIFCFYTFLSKYTDMLYIDQGEDTDEGNQYENSRLLESAQSGFQCRTAKRAGK